MVILTIFLLLSSSKSVPVYLIEAVNGSAPIRSDPLGHIPSVPEIVETIDLESLPASLLLSTGRAMHLIL